MKLRISAIGKLKAGPEQELFSRYFERIQKIGPTLGFPGITIEEFSESHASQVIQRKKQDAAQLLKNSNAALIIALDESGEQIDSKAFSRNLAEIRDNTGGEIQFIVGGPDGLDNEIISTAKITICFGKMTWPHQIARILLVEQIYRAMTILSDHPYHRQ